MSRRPSIVQVGYDHLAVPARRVERMHRIRNARGRQPVLPPGAGMVALATCHRLELYLENVPASEASAIFAGWCGIRGNPHRSLRIRTGDDAGVHLARVAAGLESAVLGEDQILTQVRRAYREACADRSAGPLLHRLFHATFRAGKRVRTETGLAGGGRSLAGAAVATLHRELGGLRERTVLVLGTGEMGTLAARRLRGRGVGRLVLCNRTHATAATLASRVGAEALRWEWRSAILPRVDGVVCATGAREPVIEAESLARAAAGRSGRLVVVDLAVPRGVERPRTMPRELSILDVETLSATLRVEAARRSDAVRDAEGIVYQEIDRWIEWAGARQERGDGRPVTRRDLAIV